MTDRKITIRCQHCGGADVKRDAYAFWNDDTQEWEVSEIYDDARCEDCDGDTRLVERYLDTGEPVAEHDLYDCEKWTVRDTTNFTSPARFRTGAAAGAWVDRQARPDRFNIEPPEQPRPGAGVEDAA